MIDFFIIFAARYLIFLLLLSIIPLWRKHYTKAALKTVISVILAFSIGELIKHFFYAPRPFTVYGINPLFPQEPDGSFPSGHTAALSALSFSIFLIDKKLGIVLFFGTLIVGLARIISLIHFPVDILGGLIIGVSVAFIFNSFFPYILKVAKRKK